MMKKTLSKEDIEEMNIRFKYSGIALLIMILLIVVTTIYTNSIDSNSFGEYKEAIENTLEDIYSLLRPLQWICFAFIVFWSYYFILFRIYLFKNPELR